MKEAQQSMKEYSDRHRLDMSFEVGDQVWMSTKNLMTERPS